MSAQKHRRSLPAISRLILPLLTVAVVNSPFAFAQPPHAAAGHASSVSDSATTADLTKQIADLRDQVTRLEATLASSAGKSGGMSGGMMGEMDSMGGGSGSMSGMSDSSSGMMADMDDAMMGGMAGKTGGMAGGAMGGGSGSMSGAMMDDMGMMGMMGMGAGASTSGMRMQAAAALPGFPGVSHLYHIGARDFFLDHPQHLTLTTEQQVALGQARQRAVTEKAAAQRLIEQAEQELWVLTAADTPDAEEIEQQVRKIESLRANQRLAFIRAVGAAASLLTDEQRRALLGIAELMSPQQSSASGHSTTP